MSQTKPPAWVWGLLVAAVFGVSSAGTLLQQIDLDPLLKASWRLQLTSVVLFPFAIWQWRQQPEAIKQQMFERRTLGILALSGLALALHFGSWVASLKYTTLTHSLLFVTAHPLIVVAGMFFLGFMAIGVRKPTSRELAGAMIGFCGAALTLFDEGTTQGDQTVTILGDSLALLGALTVVGYIVCGRILRTWMPIFLYAFPVTLLGAVLLLPASFLVEDDFAIHGVFGWVQSEFFYWFLALALIAGLLGHTGLNTCLKYLSPLVISACVTLEPVIGSFIGYVLFDTDLPGRWTWIGGAVLMVGLMLIVTAMPSEEDTKDETASVHQ
ncbi:MAG: DMT family transporter [Candidatus Poseidoniales archaeon]|nr:MAG: DMT family transporter [Candidatus Poseidoniales archaeon]